MTHDADREWLLELLQRYGRNLHSFMVLEPGLSVWRSENAAIAYVARGGYRVAVGEPLCAPERTTDIVRQFRNDSLAVSCKIVFFGVSEAFVDRLKESTFDKLQVGLAPSWHPAAWEEVVRHSRKLRNRLNKAERDGIKTRLLSTHEISEGTSLRAQFVELANQWSRSKALPPMGFMVTLELFQHAHCRRYFVAEHKGKLVGFAVCIPVYGKNGWLLEDMIISPIAPPGCSEALVHTAMCNLASERAEYVSLGMVALAGLRGSKSPNNHRWLSSFLRICSRTMGWLYNFEGLYRFRNKMHPNAWEPIYIVAGSPITLLTIRAILMAFAQGWVPRFGLRVIRHWLRKRMSPATENQVLARPILDGPSAMLAVASLAAVLVAVLGSACGWWSAWISVAIGTLGAYVGFTPVHEAVHGNVSRFPIVNQCVGHVGSLLLAGAFQPYCYLHGEHHRHTNVASEDPDVWCGSVSQWQLPIRWATQDVGYLLFYFGNWNHRPMWERCNLLGCACLYACIVVSIAIVSTTWLMALVWGWILPARLALFFLAATFSWLPHEPHQETEPFRATSVRSSPWLTWVLLGQNHHLVHHLDPKIPFYRLSRAWKRSRNDMLRKGVVDWSQRVQ